MIEAPSARFAAALLTSHERRIRVTLFTWELDGTLVERGPIDVVDGMLTIDADAASWRRLTGNMVMSDEVGASIEGLNVYNGELRVELGIQFADEVEWVQLGQLRVEETSRRALQVGGSVTAFDRAVRVGDFPFVTPYAPRDLEDNPLTTVESIKDIIATAFPSNAPPAFVVDPAVDAAATPPPETSFTGARWEAVRKLAESIGVTVHNDRLGRFVIRPAGVSGTPVATITSGLGGTLLDHGSSRTRVDQYNAVGITCETPSGDGIFAYVVDADPASPTYYDGPFGRKPHMVRNDTITTVDGAVAAARALLNRKKSAARDLDLDVVYNPLLEPMDVITVHDPQTGEDEVHVIDTIDLSLKSAKMGLKTHKWMPEPVVLIARRGGREVLL